MAGFAVEPIHVDMVDTWVEGDGVVDGLDGLPIESNDGLLTEGDSDEEGWDAGTDISDSSVYDGKDITDVLFFGQHLCYSEVPEGFFQPMQVH